MKFKLLIILLVSLMPTVIFGFPKLSPEDVKIQTELVQKINLDPRNPALRFELAMEYASTGWIELGWDQLKLVPELQKGYETIVFNQYSNAIKTDPNDWTAHFRLAFAYYFMDKKDLAIQSFQQALTIYPNHVWSMGLIALIYGEQKNYDKCIEWSKKALRINDDATAIHFLLGKAYYETGNYFGVLGESLSVGRLKSIESKYRPVPPKGIE